MTNHCQQLLTRLNNYRQQAKKFKEVTRSFKEPADLRQAMEEYQQAGNNLIEYSESLIDIPADTNEKIAVVDYLVLDRMIRMLPDEDKREFLIASLIELVNTNRIALQKGRVTAFAIRSLARETDTPEIIKQRTEALNQAGYLTQLRWLSLSGNSLTQIDLSRLTQLQWLWLSGNSLTQIDVSRLTQLRELWLAKNPIPPKERKRLLQWAERKGAKLYF